MTKEQWMAIFAKAKHGHILWDGNAENPSSPIHAYNTAWSFVRHGEFLGMFRPNSHILDLGCGNGRFGIPFSEMDVTYEGVDPVRECIDFCREAFQDYPRLHFQFADVYNEVFNPSGTINPKNYQLPFDQHSFDDVICYSVFTHLQTVEVATAYMREIKRVIKPGGKLFCTWYRSPPNPQPDPYVGRTVYLESDIMSLLQGFTFQCTYGGHTDAYYDQWGLFCTKSNTTFL